ncbi:hypothetical protein LCGC14_0246080 [marine sediment metagenome]|uniref:Uncharacterized protein n=1 Tax=marine sediment metagenome TaxID=412755 RepID=A0A0F9UMJ0_9ZZZZ
MKEKISNIHIPSFVDLLAEYQINEHQFMICWFVHTKDMKTYYKYTQEVSHVRRADLEELVEKGVLITPSSNLNTYELDSMSLTGSFAEGLFVLDAREAAMELWNKYPVRFTKDDGTNYPAKTVTDRDKLLEYYIRQGIGYNLNVHKNVLKLTDVYLELVGRGEMTGLGIEKYIRGHYWEQVEVLAKELGYGI